MQEKSIISTDTTNHNDINNMQANILSSKRDTNIDLVAQMTKTLATMTTDATSSTTNTVNVDNKTIDAAKIEQKSSPVMNNSSSTTNTTTTTQQSPPLLPPPPTSHAPQSNVIATRPTKRTANDYRFGKTIGEGSFSTVYLAKDIYTNREVASEYSVNDSIAHCIAYKLFFHIIDSYLKIFSLSFFFVNLQ